MHNEYNLVRYSYFCLIDRIRIVIGRRDLSSAALKRIFEVVGVSAFAWAIITSITAAIRAFRMDMATTS
jgi:hypothetical protein